MPVAVPVLVLLAVIAARWRPHPPAAAMVVVAPVLTLTAAGAARVARAAVVVMRRMPRAPVVTVMVARRLLTFATTSARMAVMAVITLVMMPTRGATLGAAPTALSAAPGRRLRGRDTGLGAAATGRAACRRATRGPASAAAGRLRSSRASAAARRGPATAAATTALMRPRVLGGGLRGRVDVDHRFHGPAGEVDDRSEVDGGQRDSGQRAVAACDSQREQRRRTHSAGTREHGRAFFGRLR